MKIKANYSIKEINDIVIIINKFDSSDIYEINEWGKIILENIDKEIDIILSIIKDKYNVLDDISTLNDIIEFINNLTDLGIVEN